MKDELVDYVEGLGIGSDIDKNRSYLIGILHRAQQIYGYLPKDVQKFIADSLRITLADVYGVISFYSFFSTTIPGRNQVHVCTGTACFVKGAGNVLKKLEEELEIKDGETRADLEYSLGSLRCVGACSLAPVVIVNDFTYGDVTPKSVKKIIRETK